MAPQFIYVMKALKKVIPPSRIILDDIWLSFYPGAKIGVLGPNGAGKSSLLKIMAGVDTDFQGEAWAHKGTRIGYLPQEPQLDESLTVQGNVELAVKAQRDLLKRFEAISLKFAEPMDDDAMNALIEEQGKVQEQIDAHDLWNLDNKIEVAMDALRLPPPDAGVKTLSGGEKRRVALCRVLLEEPDMLLLDEPTNHLDAESVAWLEHFLESFPGTVVAITHDRYFLDNVAKWILELDHGRGIPFEGNYSGWLEQKEARLALEEKQSDARRRSLQRELEWVRMAPKARQAKGKARLAAYEKLRSEADAARGQDQRLEMTIPATERLGDVVIEADHLSKGFGDRLLIDDLTFKLPRAGIVGVVGPNGAGKTTLFRMIVAAANGETDGNHLPDSGTLSIGQTVQLAYVDQSRDALDADHTVYEEITDGQDLLKIGNREVNGRAYVASFNFKGSDQQKRVGDLSGGELSGVDLAKMLRRGGNVLLLDEPTNDLDVDTLRALEAGLDAYPGCAVVISHDRWFLDRIATHILAFEGDSQLRWFEGNFSEYEAYRHQLLGAEADQPHRIKYKPLSRG